VDRFIFDITAEEKDIAKKSKLRSLTLDDTEWDQIREFCELLSVCLSFRIAEHNF
jgi:hypothetical protein